MTNTYYGIYQGVVTDIKDPERRGRIKVICPDVLGGDEESAWCDPVVPVAYDTGGDFCIPELEEMVWVMFIAGDVDQPVWLGGWWSEDSTPLGETYEDADQVRIISYRDCTITMQDGKISIEVIGSNNSISIEDGKIKIKGDLIVEGNITSNSLSANSVTASGVSLSTHTHGGVESGSSSTGQPN